VAADTSGLIFGNPFIFFIVDMRAVRALTDADLALDALFRITLDDEVVVMFSYWLV
jgi:hypothetical protein